MAYKIQFEVLLSNSAMMGIQRYGLSLNLPEIACKAIRDEILSRAAVDNVVEEISPMSQNNHLWQQLAESRQEIARLRRMGYGQAEGLKLMARSISPVQARAMVEVNR